MKEIMMDCEEYKENREKYNYPAVALEGNYEDPGIRYFNATMGLDKYIQELLLSDCGPRKVLGYLSVLFWGFYSGQDGRIRDSRALGKVALARDGKYRNVNGKKQRMKGIIDFGEHYVVEQLKKAIHDVENNQYGDALRALIELPQLQVAFASKVCAFIDPGKCGVIDSVIVAKKPSFGFETNKQGMITKKRTNIDTYNEYCEFLQEQAKKLNNSGCKWVDRDGKEYDWRALDVERSMY